MRIYYTLPFFLLSLSMLYSCSSKPDLAKEEKAIRELLQQERKAHFDRDADLFISEFAEGMIGVNKGEVSVLEKTKHKERVSAYFGRVEFIKWDDVQEPIIRFSDDGTMAYAIIQKEVILKEGEGKDTAHYAWASIYRKQNGVWKVEANISTNK